MILRRVLDVMNKNLYRVDILKKISEVQNTFYKENIDCSAVYNNETLVGILTLRDLVIANPNSIIKDVMTDRYTCIDYKEYIWKLKEIYDSIDGMDSIFVKNKNDIVGYVSRTIINIELGKHIDLLTGLYKNDDLTQILEKVESADAIIMGSPIYAGTVTGVIKSFMERLIFQY